MVQSGMLHGVETLTLDRYQANKLLATKKDFGQRTANKF